MTLEQLEKKVTALEKRLTVLEKKGRRINGHKPSGVRKTPASRARRAKAPALTEQEKQKRALEILRAKGIVVELVPEARAEAAKWRALPQVERERLLQQFYNMPLDKPLSEIVTENRG